MRISKFKSLIVLLTVCLGCALQNAHAQNRAPRAVAMPDSLLKTGSTTLPDSISLTYSDSVVTDSMAADTVQKVEIPKKSSAIDAEVQYSAVDSMVFFQDGTGYLYNQAKVKYMQQRPIELEAKYIRFNMDSSTVYATGGVDTLGNAEGEPVFKDGDDSYSSKYMSYNFKTRRGYVRGIVTQQEESYIVSDETKMFEDNRVYMRGGRLTTCDQHDHPHFYMQLTKAKMEPSSYLASGPAYFVIGDVPLPIAIPFGFFPVTSKYNSGIIMPSFGEELDRGLFIKDGGYYWAINDYVDLEILGDLYTKGTWAVSLNSKYNWRYHFNGNISLSYREDVRGEKNMPDYSKQKNFKVSWRHQQDAKSSLYSSFSASVDFTTSGYNTANINNYYNPEEQSKNITSSSVNYTQRFPESKWSISVNASLTQRTQDSTISLNLPSLTVNLSQTYPFKRKNPVGKERWYEKIYLSYSMEFNNKVDCKESEFIHTDFLRDWKNGVRHKFNVGAAYTFFKYLNFSVGAGGNWTWYFNKINRDWDTQSQTEVMDTTYGFYNVYSVNANVSLSTKLYGFYTPIRRICGDRVDKFRHLFTPSVRFNYSPDFSDEKYGMYSSYEKMVLSQNSRTPISSERVSYSPFSHGIYGVTGRGTTAAISFSLDNNIEMKVKDRKDTTGLTYKKVSVIDLFSLGWGYNFAADSLRWNDLTAKIRLKLTKSLTINLATSFDPYQWIYNDKGAIVHSNRLHWDNHEPMHFTGFGTTFSYTFDNNTFKPKSDKDKDNKDGQSDDVEIDPTTGKPVDPNIEIDPLTGKPKAKFDHDHDAREKMDADEDGYAKLDIPWSLTVSYTFNYKESRTKEYYKADKHVYGLKFTHNLSVSGSIRPAPKWSVTASMYVDLTSKKITSMTMTVDRDLHCWRLSASISPVGLYKSFLVTIGISANMLKDVKYDKRSDNSTSVNWIDKE